LLPCHAVRGSMGRRQHKQCIGDLLLVYNWN
jgi:hypothetical protein